VDWADELADLLPATRVVVQFGTSRTPRHAFGFTACSAPELAGWMAKASVVVAQGGPSTIVEARNHGLMPIVVPRDPSLGEHVDGHQMRFAAHMAGLGKIRLATDKGTLEQLVRQSLSASRAVPAVEVRSSTSATAVAIDARLSRLVGRVGPDRPAPGRAEVR
jgi:UDP-N-acetylglucosamine transferase subunit ALG13